jgi:hypothetical protein
MRRLLGEDTGAARGLDSRPATPPEKSAPYLRGNEPTLPLRIPTLAPRLPLFYVDARHGVPTSFDWQRPNRPA